MNPSTLQCLLLDAWWLTASILHLAPSPPVPLTGEAVSQLLAAWLCGLLSGWTWLGWSSFNLFKLQGMLSILLHCPVSPASTSGLPPWVSSQGRTMLPAGYLLVQRREGFGSGYCSSHLWHGSLLGQAWGCPGLIFRAVHPFGEPAAAVPLSGGRL